MNLPKKSSYILIILLALGLLFTTPKPTLAANTQDFYDWGPYYQTKPKVYGLKVYAQSQATPAALPENLVLGPPSFVPPNNPFYFIKQLGEQVQTIFTFDPIKKEEVKLSHAKERLAETNYLIQIGNFSLAEESAKRYQRELNSLTEDLKNLKEKGSNIAALVEKVENEAASQVLVWGNLIQNSPPVITISINNALEFSQKALDITSDLQGKSAIPPDLSESLQELKKQGLLTSEETSKIYELKTREEVRVELSTLVEGNRFPSSELKKLDEKTKEIYPNDYQKSFQNEVYRELLTSGLYPKPDLDTLQKLEDFKKTFQEGEPIVPDIKKYLPYIRLEKLSKEIRLDLLDQAKEEELRKLYPHELSANSTATLKSVVPTEPKAQENSEPLATPSGSPAQTPTSLKNLITTTQGLLPDNPFYFTKALTEQFLRISTFDKAGKLELDLKFAEERLKETIALIEKNSPPKYVANSFNLYAKDLESVSKEIKQSFFPSETKKLKEEYGDKVRVAAIARTLEDDAIRANLIFEKSLINIPPDHTQLLQEAIKTTQNSLDRAADLLGKPAVPTAVVDRLQDLKAQGLLLPEEVDSVIQAKSREEARGELRKLARVGSIPPADEKKMDDSQSQVFPGEFNKLIEARKVEELQSLRVTQDNLSQTPVLKQTEESYAQRINQIKEQVATASALTTEDFVGKQSVYQKYQELVSTPSAQTSSQLTESTQLATLSVGLAKETGFLPDNPFYFLKTGFEAIQRATVFGFEAEQTVRLAQAQERLNESYSLLKKNNEKEALKNFERFTKDFSSLTEDLKNKPASAEVKRRVADKLDDVVVQDRLLLERIVPFVSEHASGTLTTAIAETTKGFDRALDNLESSSIPEKVKESISKIPNEMFSQEERDKLFNSSREEARTKLADLISKGIANANNLILFDEPIQNYNPSQWERLTQIRLANELIGLEESREKTQEQREKNEEIVNKLAEFQKNFKPGETQNIPEEIRPYLAMTRIEELSRTIRPDLIVPGDFSNRKDLLLAVATLREQIKPSVQDFERVDQFLKDNPNKALPPDLARIRGISYSIGFRQTNESCILPSPPFQPNTPCPPPGRPIPIQPFYTAVYNPAPTSISSTYGQGPKPIREGVCPEGYHWMSDSGGWCMSNSSAYGPGATPTPTPTTRIGGPNYDERYFRDTNRYIESYYNYTPPPSPTGSPLVYGEGPLTVSPRTCVEGYHWMEESWRPEGGWCMSNGGNYGGGGPYPTINPYPTTFIPPNPNPWPYPTYPYPTYPGPTYYPNPYPTYPGPTTIGDVSPNDGCPYGYDREPNTGRCSPNSYPNPYPTYNPSPTTGSCPAGYHSMFGSYNSDGYCMSDFNSCDTIPAGRSYGCVGQTPNRTYTPYPTYYSPNPLPTSGDGCPYGYYRYYEAGYGRCVPNPGINPTYTPTPYPTYSSGPYPTYTSGPYPTYSSGPYPTSTSVSCPGGYHSMGDYCMSDSNPCDTIPAGRNYCSNPGSTSYPSPTAYPTSYPTAYPTSSPSPTYTPPPSPTYTPPPPTPTGSCPSGYHFMGQNWRPEGDCMKDSDSSILTPATY